MTMIFLDMDGVLADFSQHLKNLEVPPNEQWHDPRDTWTEETWRREKIKVALMHNYGFWNEIPHMRGATLLWEYCKPLKPFILSAQPLPNSPRVVFEDKYRWVKEQLDPEFPEYRMIVCPIGGKGRYAKPGYILIDDDAQRNGAEWVEKGGIFIHHTSPEQSIADLEEVLTNVRTA